MAQEDQPVPAHDETKRTMREFKPPEKHKAADRAGKTLGHMAYSINEVLDEHDEPVVLNRKGSHVSIKSLEELIDSALEENSRQFADATDDLPTYLQQIMAEKAVSVAELAHIAALPTHLISEVLQGHVKPDASQSRALADALDVPYEIVARLADLP